MYRIYSLIFGCCFLLAFPYYTIRFRRYLPTLRDRFGFVRVRLDRSVWVHAVSVGEVNAVEKLIVRLAERDSGRPIVLSTVTPTGQQVARSLKGIVRAAFYFPLDLPGCVGRALDRIRPEAVIIAETEIWPNFLRACRKRQVPVFLINGRLSDRSFARYRWIRWWLRTVLADYALLGMQSERDKCRMEAIGADPEKVVVLGNLKFDAAASDRSLDPQLAGFLTQWGSIWIAASTMPGEEESVLDGFARVRLEFPALKLLIAPRHPERFDQVEEILQQRSIAYMRRTRLGLFLPEENVGVMLLDTIGELAATFEYASVVFMGGTLVQRGGHNILEPAKSRKPVIFGPHMENFREIAQLFLDAGAAIQIDSAHDLGPTVCRLLSDSALASELGKSARRLVEQNTGATERVLSILRPAGTGQ